MASKKKKGTPRPYTRNTSKLQFNVGQELLERLEALQDEVEGRGAPRPNMPTVCRMLLETALRTEPYYAATRELTILVMRKQLALGSKLRASVIANIETWLDELERDIA